VCVRVRLVIGDTGIVQHPLALSSTLALLTRISNYAPPLLFRSSCFHPALSVFPLFGPRLHAIFTLPLRYPRAFCIHFAHWARRDRHNTTQLLLLKQGPSLQC
jgi:hypothetical protein